MPGAAVKVASSLQTIRDRIRRRAAKRGTLLSPHRDLPELANVSTTLSGAANVARFIG